MADMSADFINCPQQGLIHMFLITSLWSWQKIMNLDVCDMCVLSFICNFKYKKQKAKMLFWPKKTVFQKLCKILVAPNADVAVMRCLCFNCENCNKEASKKYICYISLLCFPAKCRRDCLGASCFLSEISVLFWQ